MKNLRNQLPALFFLALLLAPGIWHGWLQLRQQQVWHQMEEALEKESLQTLEITTGQLEWVRPGKEIRLNGRLFDVKTLHQLPGNKVRLSGLFDEEETELREKFERTQGGPTAARTLRFFAFLYYTKTYQPLPTPPECKQQKTRLRPQPDYWLTVKEIPTPPPRFYS